MYKIGDLVDLAEIYQLLLKTAADKTYGPYTRPDGRKIVIVKDDKGNSRTVSFPKYIMEQHLGKQLDPDDGTVDHLDFNFDNNDLSNLRVVPRDQHSADDTRRVKLIKLKCQQCKKDFERSPRLLRDKSKKGAKGIFCSRSCAGKYNRAVQLGLAEPLSVQPFVESEYYRRKNVVAVAQELSKKYGALDFS